MGALKYSNDAASHPCKECEAGTVSKQRATSSCDKCSSGTYQSSKGKTSCKDCSEGRFMETTGSKNSAWVASSNDLLFGLKSRVSLLTHRLSLSLSLSLSLFPLISQFPPSSQVHKMSCWPSDRSTSRFFV